MPKETKEQTEKKLSISAEVEQEIKYTSEKEGVNNKKNDTKEVNYTDEIIDFFKDLTIIAIVVFFIIRPFVGMPFQIKGQSMYSSYYDKEFIVVDIISYIVGSPKRGDVIVFKPNVSKIRGFFLKRIIGMPGDTVRIEKGEVYLKVKGSNTFKMLDETYLNEENKGNTFVSLPGNRNEYIVPNNEYFVLGDNRNHSTDSRECFSSCLFPGSSHFITDDDITGKVFLDLGYFSFSKFSFLHPELGIKTTPKFLNSHKNHSYEGLLSDG
ncbi:MAG: signal peptidase I [Candidatus Gracilibacteria bacterium]|nr:signal peptidase I [Candidatus Gracilibacteria bacterium]